MAEQRSHCVFPNEIHLSLISLTSPYLPYSYALASRKGQRHCLRGSQVARRIFFTEFRAFTTTVHIAQVIFLSLDNAEDRFMKV